MKSVNLARNNCVGEFERVQQPWQPPRSLPQPGSSAESFSACPGSTAPLAIPAPSQLMHRESVGGSTVAAASLSGSAQGVAPFSNAAFQSGNHFTPPKDSPTGSYKEFPPFYHARSACGSPGTGSFTGGLQANLHDRWFCLLFGLQVLLSFCPSRQQLS